MTFSCQVIIRFVTKKTTRIQGLKIGKLKTLHEFKVQDGKKKLFIRGIPVQGSVF